MAKTLGQAQREFAFDISTLIRHIYASGYECTFGDAYRSPKAFGGMGEKGPYGREWSAHKQRLAVDLNLFKDNQYMMDTEDHLIFGEYWESLNEYNRWGGRWEDGNHYSRWHGGIA